jgi:hypothetical protein
MTPHQEEAMRMIVSSGDLLLTVVNDVLDYSKLESGNVEIEMRHSSLQETLNSTVHSIETKAQSKNIEIHTIYDAYVPEYIETDNRRLQQILYNLLGNAVKFSKDGGVIELTVSTSCASSLPRQMSLPSSLNNRKEMAARPIYNKLVQAHPAEGSESYAFLPSSLHNGEDNTPIQAYPVEESKNYADSSPCPSWSIRFEVKDYGKGIENKDFTQIFKPFQQASAETERVYGGTGLGLAITAKLVHTLGGTISVDSHTGEWTTFTVDLPMRQDPADVDQLSGDLQDVVLYIVEENVEGENNRLARHRLERILRRFQAKYWCFESLTDLEKHLAIGPSAPSTTSAVSKQLRYIQEDLFDSEPYLRISKKIPSVLSTFGPKYSVEQTALHYRSLLKVLP